MKENTMISDLTGNISWKRVLCWILFPLVMAFYNPVFQLTGVTFGITLVIWWGIFYGIVHLYHMGLNEESERNEGNK